MKEFAMPKECDIYKKMNLCLDREYIECLGLTTTLPKNRLFHYKKNLPVTKMSGMSINITHMRQVIAPSR